MVPSIKRDATSKNHFFLRLILLYNIAVNVDDENVHETSLWSHFINFNRFNQGKIDRKSRMSFFTPKPHMLREMRGIKITSIS